MDDFKTDSGSDLNTISSDPVLANDLLRIVENSNAENSKGDPAPAAKGAKRKHKGGRPRKDGRPRKSDLEAAALGAELGAGGPLPGPDAKVEDDIDLDVGPEVLGGLIQTAFDIPKQRTGYPGFGLPDAEAAKYGRLADRCLKQYLPQLKSEHAAAIGLGFGLGMTALVQYMGFQQWKREQAELKAKTADAS